MNWFDQFLKAALDYLANGAVLFGLIAAIITFLLYGVLVVLQALEYIQINDFLKKYRWNILVFITIALITQIPSIMLLYYRQIGVGDLELDNLRNLATVTGRLGPLAQGIAFAVMFFYRRDK